MSLTNQQIGKGIQIFGWLVVLVAAAVHGYGIYATLTDASVRVYALFVVFQGVVFVSAGLFLVWVGSRVSKSKETDETGKIE